MMFLTTPVNYLAVLISAVVSMVVGFIWYHPLVFGKKWLKYIHMTEKETKEMNMGSSYLIMFVSSLVTAYVMAHFLLYSNAQTALDGAKTAFWLWLGFVATTGLGDVLFGGKLKKPWGMYLIQMSHYLVNFAILGGILTVWR